MRYYTGLLACGALLGGCATSADMPIGLGEGRVYAAAPAPAPGGLMAFCIRAPEECAAVQPAAAVRSEVFLTEARWRELDDVNRAVNRAIAPVTDADLYGLADFWARPTGAGAAGDCEDYALEKRARLIALGWPADALALAIAVAPSVGVHAALIAQTDRGDFVLDNLHREPQPVDGLNYLWLSRQSGAGLAQWAFATRDEPGTTQIAAPLTAEEIFHRRLGVSLAEAERAEPASTSLQR